MSGKLIQKTFYLKPVEDETLIAWIKKQRYWQVALKELILKEANQETAN